MAWVNWSGLATLTHVKLSRLLSIRRWQTRFRVVTGVGSINTWRVPALYVDKTLVDALRC